MATVEIYFSDLTPEAQAQVMEAFGVKDPSEMNWDIDMAPLTVIAVDEEEDEPDGVDLAEFLRQQGLTEEESAEIINDPALACWLMDILSKSGSDASVYESLEEWGHESDNGLREEDDTDEEFGQFLLQAAIENDADRMFAHEFGSGKVMVVE